MGRTGTMSLKHALEELGYSKCHHMIEVFQNPHQLQYWKDIAANKPVDFDKVFEGYQAVVDFPGSIFYKKLMQVYPEAKVILTQRDPEKWYKSVSDTIYQLPRGFDRIMMKLVGLFKPEVAKISRNLDFANEIVWLDFFQDKFQDKDFAIQKFVQWNEEVKKVVPAEKLLVFEIQNGWEPLCSFLEKPVPSTPFPRVNDTAEFKARKMKFDK